MYQVLVAASDGGGVFPGSSHGAKFLSSYLGFENEILIDGPDHDPHRSEEKMWHASFEFLKNLSQATQQVFSRHTPLLCFSGDHSSALGVLSGVRLAFPKARIGVIWIDAHSDLHSPWTSPSGNIHGMPVAGLLGQDHLKLAKNQPSNVAKFYWDRLKSLTGLNPAFLPNNFLFLGLRDFEAEEAAYLDEACITALAPDIIQKNPYAVLDLVQNHIDKHDLVFVSYDLDSLCGSQFISTGLPIANGLSPDFIAQVIELARRSPKFLGLEVAEFSPHPFQLIDDLRLVRTSLTPILNQISKKYLPQEHSRI